MLRLKNIKITDKYIEADYIPEDGAEMGYVRLYFSTDERISKPADGFEYMYPQMAFKGLKRILEESKNNSNYVIPEERLVMWY